MRQRFRQVVIQQVTKLNSQSKQSFVRQSESRGCCHLSKLIYADLIIYVTIIYVISTIKNVRSGQQHYCRPIFEKVLFYCTIA